MKSFFDIIVVIPIGPRCNTGHVEDTIRSFVHYTRSSYKIVLADDSHQGTAAKLQQLFPAVDVLNTPKPMGKLCGLYVTLSLAFRHVLDHYSFSALLRLDTDALIIGEAPEKEAIAFFQAHPHIGIAGQYPNDYEGKPWDRSWPEEQLRKYLGGYHFLRRPLAHYLLWRRYRKAEGHGYRSGESVFGGACFYSENGLKALHKNGLLPNYFFKKLNLEEDHLFSLLMKSTGMGLGDLSSGKGSLACAWLGLPAAPEALLQSGKKIVHSTRYWKDLKETEIRSFFRHRRQSTGILTSTQTASF